MRFVVGLTALAALLYFGIVAMLFAQQRRFVFPASPERVTAQAAGLAGFEDVELPTQDGERIVGWWKPPEPGKALLLYFHGNGGSLFNRRDRARALTQDGRGLLIVSYRGYSGSTGSPSEDGLRLDAEAAFRFLSSYEPRRIVLYGESLGSGVAVRLASEHPVGGVILDSPFTSIVDVARGAFWWVPLDLLLRDQFRSIDRIGKVRASLLVLHGARDAVVPITFGERLFAAANEPKRFIRLPAVDHVSVLERGGLARVRIWLNGIEAALAAERGTAASPRANE